MKREVPIRIVRQLDEFASLTKLVHDIGSNIETKVFTSKIIESNCYISQCLKVPLATEVFYISRLRIIDGVPCTIATSYILANLVPDIEKEDLNNLSIYQYLEDVYKIKMYRASEELLIVEPNEMEQEYLGLNEGDKLLMIKGVAENTDNQLVEYFENVALTDLYIFKG